MVSESMENLNKCAQGQLKIGIICKLISKDLRQMQCDKAKIAVMRNMFSIVTNLCLPVSAQCHGHVDMGIIVDHSALIFSEISANL